MNIDNLVWYTVAREDLPGAAFGRSTFRSQESRSPQELHPDGAPANVAFAADEVQSLDYRPPALFLLHEKNSAETLSWIRVFAREFFPLSQFARVLTDRDWAEIVLAQPDGIAIRTDKWASVILGEVLAQGESDADLESIPLSRASSCFTMAISRAAFIHDSFAVTRICTERLRLVEDDSRFSKRAVSVDSLIPIWALVSASVSDTHDIRELADLVVHAAESVGPPSPLFFSSKGFLASYDRIFSDSVEERVIAFHRMASEVLGATTGKQGASATASAIVAVGAFLVGRGTSHAFLLRKFPTIAPSAFLWFGLVAALSGPRGWDPAWSRYAKGVERQIRTTFVLKDPPAADICWAEYNWLSRSISGASTFSDIARYFPRSLSVEIVPGATFQFRVASEGRMDAPARQEAERDVKRTDLVSRDGDVRGVLQELVNLSEKARVLLGQSSSGAAATEQRSLDFGEKALESTKAKTKKGYRRSPDRQG